MEVEALASKFHDIYQQEVKRQGRVRHKDKYEDLPEHIKELDRVLARYVIAEQDKLRTELAEKDKQIERLKAIETKLKILEQCDKCKFTNPKGRATCPDHADGELPCAGFESKALEQKGK